MLEYATSIWSPHKKCDIDQIEKVQRYFTRRVLKYSNQCYKERIVLLNLQSLKLRREIFDLCLVYKILNGLVEFNETDFFTKNNSNTRSNNSFKLQTQHSRIDIRHKFFSNRIIHNWNSLPDFITNSSNLTNFRNQLNLSQIIQSLDYSEFLANTVN